MSISNKSVQFSFTHSSISKALHWIGIVVIVLSSSCDRTDRLPIDNSNNMIILLNPESELGEEWEHRRLRRTDTTYTRVESAFGHTIRAEGNNSASILFRVFEPIALNCNTLRWSWYVEKPQQSSDLRTKGMDDVAASVFVMFGDSGIFRDIPVPTLKYVWANKQHRIGEIITGPYLKESVRTIVIRRGSPVDQKLVTERVNLSEDYKNAFGESLNDGVNGIAIFTDNDDTRESIVAHYGKIELLCNE